MSVHLFSEQPRHGEPISMHHDSLEFQRVLGHSDHASGPLHPTLYRQYPAASSFEPNCSTKRPPSKWVRRGQLSWIFLP
ncbi:MAG: hypothetical protein A2559_11120 [Deltaproteobacteria bacterium RIFOXYD2_FULL_66_9]|nr:MAG: hypothetical protein A2559_11120 [Deltaproteobacteria bacterium RIFOXYD2_FULL_66_9]